MGGITIWWVCEWEGERVSESVSLQVGIGKHISKYIPSMLVKIFLEKFQWHVIIYYNKSIFHQVSRNSHVIIATWIHHMDIQHVFVQSNVSTKFYQGWCPICWNKKKCLAHFLRILPPGFKHVLHGIIFFNNINILYTTSQIFKYYATSFVAIVIMAVIKGNKLNTIETWTC